jgi:hypothetical protein
MAQSFRGYMTSPGVQEQWGLAELSQEVLGAVPTTQALWV